MASSRQADGEYLPCISVHNYITNTKTIYSYSSSALRILTFPLKEGVRGCSFLTSIDCNTKITKEYTEKLWTYNFRCPLISGLEDFTLPTGWSLEESIALSKSFSYGILKIIINCDCCWRIQVNDSMIDLNNHSLLQFQNEKLTSCSTTFQLLKNADRSYMCIGNPDAKFQEIIRRKKGIFLDRFGM